MRKRNNQYTVRVRHWVNKDNPFQNMGVKPLNETADRKNCHFSTFFGENWWSVTLSLMSYTFSSHLLLGLVQGWSCLYAVVEYLVGLTVSQISSFTFGFFLNWRAKNFSTILADVFTKKSSHSSVTWGLWSDLVYFMNTYCSIAQLIFWLNICIWTYKHMFLFLWTVHTTVVP